MSTLQPTRTGVRRAGPADASAVSSALAAAFHDDPVFGWVLPDQLHRASASRRFFELVVEALAPHDDAWTTADGVLGAALWVPRGQQIMSDERAEAFAAELADLSGPYADRALELLALLDENHPHEPHEYLWFLGVVPVAQGRGVGTALLAPVLQRADAAGTPCYLEATSPRNRALYERHGFQASGEIAVAGGPALWPMWRSPS